MNLGIKSAGASFLLLRNSLASIFSEERMFNRKPALASDFASLSPIHFRSMIELQEKLDSYAFCMPKGKTNRDMVRKNNFPVSKANGIERFFDHRSDRPDFEHNRVLWNLLLDQIDPFTLSLPQRQLHARVRLVALAANFIGGNELEEWVPLDVAWQSITVECNDTDCKFARNDVQYVLFSSQLQKDGKPATRFEGGETQVECLDAARLRLQLALQPDDNEILVVLCCDFIRYLQIGLKHRLNVDTTSWKKSLEFLIGRKTIAEQAIVENNKDRKRQVKDPRIKSQDNVHTKQETTPFRSPMHGTRTQEFRKREPDLKVEGERSRSPVPLEGRYSDQGTKGESSRAPSTSYTADRYNEDSIKADSTFGNNNLHPFDDNAGAVHVTDLTVLYSIMTRIAGSDRSVTGLAKNLGMSKLLPEGWCAGNECSILLDLWATMVSGSPVDERAQELGRNKKAAENVKTEDHEQQITPDAAAKLPPSVPTWGDLFGRGSSEATMASRIQEERRSPKRTEYESDEDDDWL